MLQTAPAKINIGMYYIALHLDVLVISYPKRDRQLLDSYARYMRYRVKLESKYYLLHSESIWDYRCMLQTTPVEINTCCKSSARTVKEFRLNGLTYIHYCVSESTSF